MLQEMSKFNTWKCSSILAGDFNSAPGGAIYNTVIKDGYVSAYSNYRGTGKEPDFTCIKKDQNFKLEKRCIDYIWYKGGTNTLLATHLLDLIPDQLVKEGLPNEYCPSDHMDLKAVFQFVRDKIEEIQ